MNNPSFARLLTGVGVVGFGVLALLGSLGIIDFANLWSNFWPVLLLYAAIIMIVADRSQYLWSAVLVIAGVAFLLRNLGVTDFNIFKLFWPVVIIAIGLSILLQNKKRPAADSASSDNLFALLSGIEQRSSADDYKDSKVTAILGGVSLDLRQAIIKKEANIDVFVLMGGLELSVPRDWIVVNNVGAVLGGVENKANTDATTKSPRLILSGTVALGGIEIKH